MDYGTQDIAFDQTVRMGLEKGISEASFVDQGSLPAKAALIDDDSIHGFLMVPTKGFSESGKEVEDAYRVWWEKLKGIVNRILPKLDHKDEPRWSEY